MTIISNQNKAILIKRSKSFIWRLGGMLAIALLDFVGGQLGLFNLPPEVVVVVGLILSEVTKQLNKTK